MKLGFELEADEIIPNLWQGSFPRLLSASEVGFQVVVLCASEKLGYDDKKKEYQAYGMHIVEAPFDDTVYPSSEELTTAHWASVKVVNAVKEGKKVLVTCMAGLNRSGLVTAISVRALCSLKGHEAVELVKKARGDDALCNRVFASYVYNMK